MTGNGTHSAEVVALTAEVRALMVGSRQVTLSVYRQLDTVEPEEIEPFGRVRDSKDVQHSSDYLDRLDRNHVPDDVKEDAPFDPFGLTCHETTTGLYVVGRRRSNNTLVRAATETWYHSVKSSGRWFRWRDFAHDQDLWNTWNGLDLIILAGLR